jgi:hypothetical protein
MPRKKIPDESIVENEIIEELVPIRWGDNEDLVTVYSNNLLITHAGREFYFLFGELVPPNARLIPKPKYAFVKPIVRVAVTPETMLSIADAIQKNVKAYLEKLEGAQIKEKAKDD